MRNLTREVVRKVALRFLIQPDNIVLNVLCSAAAQETQSSSKQVSHWDLLGKEDAEVFFAAFSVLAVEHDKISDVVGENGSPLTDSMVKLLSVSFAGALQLQNMDHIVAPMPEDLGKDGSHILI